MGKLTSGGSRRPVTEAGGTETHAIQRAYIDGATFHAMRPQA
jgi:hypothetical protein